MAAGGKPPPSARRVHPAAPRSPPAPSAPQLSLPKPSAVLEVRWAVAGRDRQRASPMARRRGQRGAGPLCCGRGQAPPTGGTPLSLPSSPERPSPLPRSHFPPTRFAAFGGQAGLELSRSGPASLPPPLSGEKCSQIGGLPFLFFFQLSPRLVATSPLRQINVHKEHGIYRDCGFKPGCMTLSKLLNLSASVSSSVKRLGRIRDNA